jgi:hypothetical protein
MTNVELTNKIMELVDFVIEGDDITIDLDLLNVYYQGNWLFDYDSTDKNDVLIYTTNDSGSRKLLIDRNNPTNKDLKKVSQVITDSLNMVEALIECKD